MWLHCAPCWRRCVTKTAILGCSALLKWLTIWCLLATGRLLPASVLTIGHCAAAASPQSLLELLKMISLLCCHMRMSGRACNQEG